RCPLWTPGWWTARCAAPAPARSGWAAGWPGCSPGTPSCTRPACCSARSWWPSAWGGRRDSEATAREHRRAAPATGSEADCLAARGAERTRSRAMIISLLAIPLLGAVLAPLLRADRAARWFGVVVTAAAFGVSLALLPGMGGRVASTVDARHQVDRPWI